MTSSLFQEATRIWKEFSGQPSATGLRFELDLHRTMPGFFALGDEYHYVFHLADGSFEYLSPDVETVLGYPAAQVDAAFLLSAIHPDDQPYFLNFTHRTRSFLAELGPGQLPHYKVRFDFRVRRQDGSYIRILQQAAALHHDGEGNLLRIFGVHTNITDIKEHGVPVLSFIGLNGAPSHINVEAERIYPLPGDLLTRREKEVLAFLMEGRNSQQIAEALKLREGTVHTHRKNMLRKAGVSNSSQLIVRAIREGWI
ncbi:helix-turn-helix transcriptional regulator [Flaviaesturariibacter amylovorans]|uniref:LuxR C-terminal-related transcriptional regulator n=1 Tax=Flaviaesturariibacter amylovorans TaxID=1084520 RepID=A0ABP8G5M5_9BACT